MMTTDYRPDTIWTSGYGVYDQFSKPFQCLLEGLAATYSQPNSIKEKAHIGAQGLEEGPRGAPANVGTAMKAVHPVVRTHPVTGWKSVFAFGPHCEKIDGLNDSESELLLSRVQSMVTENHSLQVRFRWQNPSDIGEILVFYPPA